VRKCASCTINVENDVPRLSFILAISVRAIVINVSECREGEMEEHERRMRGDIGGATVRWVNDYLSFYLFYTRVNELCNYFKQLFFEILINLGIIPIWIHLYFTDQHSFDNSYNSAAAHRER